MNVSLTPELEQFIQTKVRSGRYNSASEVVREALRLLENHEKARVAQLAEFNQELGRRLASLDRGERVDPVEVRARLQKKRELPARASYSYLAKLWRRVLPSAPEAVSAEKCGWTEVPERRPLLSSSAIPAVASLANRRSD